MAFKTTIRNQRVSHFVASSAVGLADKVHQQVAEKLRRLLREGESLPDLKLLQDLLGRYLEERGSQLLEVDDRYSGDQILARDLQLERERLTQQLRLRLRDARQLFDRLGREKSEVYLPKRSFSKLGAAELIRLANQAASVLRDPERSPERQAVVGAGSQAELLAGLEAEAGQLQEVLDRKEGALARQKQIGLEEKSAEIEATGKAIRGAASLLAGLYTFAELPFHARRIRRRVNRKEAAGEEGGATGAPPKAAASGGEEIVPA